MSRNSGRQTAKFGPLFVTLMDRVRANQHALRAAGESQSQRIYSAQRTARFKAVKAGCAARGPVDRPSAMRWEGYDFTRRMNGIAVVDPERNEGKIENYSKQENECSVGHHASHGADWRQGQHRIGHRKRCDWRYTISLSSRLVQRPVLRATPRSISGRRPSVVPASASA